MQEKLEIDLGLLPEEGKAFSGELDPKVFGLSEKDVKEMGGLEYDLYVQRFDDELLLRGYLGAPFEFTCVRTNKKFVQTISLEEVAVSIEVVSGVIDATEALREEVLINFPSYPRCDEGDEPMECELDERYLALDKPPEDSVSDAPSDEQVDQWSALDGFNQFKDNQ
ncbi:MAG: YceD family protein [Akkermansiaceae bacterium]